jgi:hypothetical protein
MPQLMLAAKILFERLTGYRKFGLTTKRCSAAGMPLQNRLDFEKEGRVR